MGKKKIESRISNKPNPDPANTSYSTMQTSESVKVPKVEAPKFTGPLISFRNIDVKAGGVVSVQCLDNRVPLGKIQIIQIKAGDATYEYRRV